MIIGRIEALLPGAGPLSMVVGQHEFDGWKVAVMRGAEPPIVMSVEEARRAGEALLRMADVCEGKWGDD